MVIIAVSGFALEWIEIASGGLLSHPRWVSGFALEWIEIVAITHNLNTQESPASRWSGLKFGIYTPSFYSNRSPASRWSGLK